MNKKQKLSTLERKIKPHQTDILDGLNPFKDIVEQTDKKLPPHIVYKQIREAQQKRIDSLEEFISIFSQPMVTLTATEKNFVYVHEQDVKGGILRETADDTIERIVELIREQNND